MPSPFESARDLTPPPADVSAPALAPERRLTLAARYGVGLALLAALGYMVDWEAVRNVLAVTRIELLVAALVAVLADRMLHAWAWILLLEVKLEDVRRSAFVRMHFIATFLGQFVPFNIGSDVVRVMGAARYSGNTMACVSSVVVVRALGMVSLVFSAALVVLESIGFQVSAVGPNVAWLTLATVAAGATLAAVLYSAHRIPAIASHWVKKGWSRWEPKVRSAYEACRGYADHLWTLASVFGVLQASLLNAVLITYLAASAVGMDVPAGYFFLFVPLIAFIGQLPISPNGIGLMESGYVFFFTQVGATASEALVLGLAMRMLVTLASLPGGVLLMVQGWPVRPRATAPAVRSGTVARL
jgi:uncharacterized protein (TIRG00374 family)